MILMQGKTYDQDFDIVASDTGATLEGEVQLQADEVKKRSLKGVFSYFFRTILLTGVSLVGMAMLNAKLTPAEFGVYGLAVAITGFFTIISDVGLAASVIQKKGSPTIRELRSVFTIQQILAWIIFGLIALTGMFLKDSGRIGQSGFYLALAYGISFPLVSLKTISSVLLERQLKFNLLVIPAILENFVFYFLAVLLAFKGFGVMSFTYAVLARTLVGVVVMPLIKRWPVGIEFSWGDFVKLMRVGGGFQLNDMLAKAKDDLFYISIALFVPAAEFGYITQAKTWSRQPYALTVDNITAITFPAFARLQHDEKLLAKAIEKTIFFVTLISFPLLGGLSVMAYPLIHVFPVYLKWEPALLSLALFAFSLAFSAFSTPLISTLNAIGKINVSLKMMVFWTASQWVMAPFFLKWFGFNAIAMIAAVLALSSLVVVALVYHQVHFNFIDQVWRQALATILMVLVLWRTWGLWSQSLPMFLLGIGLGAFIFATLIAVTGYKKVILETRSILKK
jgi:O-antigen/teichoic acid export membrane protein